MRVTVLSRGGLAVHGGFYDPHANAAVVLVGEGETVPLTIVFPTAPSAPAKSESGIAASAPAVSGLSLTATLSSITDGGHVDFTATVSGATRRVRIAARSNARTDGYST